MRSWIYLDDGHNNDRSFQRKAPRDSRSHGCRDQYAVIGPELPGDRARCLCPPELAGTIPESVFARRLVSSLAAGLFRRIWRTDVLFLCAACLLGWGFFILDRNSFSFLSIQFSCISLLRCFYTRCPYGTCRAGVFAARLYFVSRPCPVDRDLCGRVGRPLADKPSHRVSGDIFYSRL